MSFAKPCTWTHVVPTSGQTLTVPIVDAGTTSNYCIDNASSLALLTLTLPVTGVNDGQIIKISSKSGILGMTINAETGGFIQGLLTALLAGGKGIYQYELSTKQWYLFS